jgi:hypothetical protein
VDDADKASVQEKKIRVVYLQPGGSAPASTPLKNGVYGVNGLVCLLPTYNSFRQLTPTPQDTTDVPPPSYSSQRSPSPETFTPEQSRRSLAASIKREESPAVTAPLSYDEIKAQLAEAKATIASYEQEGGARLRKVSKGETSNETVNELAQKMQASQGVPLKIAAALCLLSFLLAYIFF